MRSKASGLHTWTLLVLLYCAGCSSKAGNRDFTAVASTAGVTAPIAGAVASAGAGAGGAGGTQPSSGSGTAGVSSASAGNGATPTAASGAGGSGLAGTTGLGASGAGGATAAGSAAVGGRGSAAGSGSAPDATSPGCGKTGARTGTYEATVMSSGRSRTYTVTAPTGYDSKVEHRLVIGFHGRDWDGKRMRQYLNLERYSDGKVVFVYPWSEKSGDYIGWKLGEFANRYGGDDDLIFFDDMLAALRETYCIDASRVFVTGQSWGGDMTQLVTCVRGAAVRAGVGVAANGTYYLPPTAGVCTGNPDIFTLHGVDDGDIPFSQGEDLRDFWAREHACQTTMTSIQPDQCVELMGCKARTVWCPYGPNNGGHQIPDWYWKTTMEWFLKY